MSIAKVGKFLVKNRAAIAFGVGTVTGVAALVETVRKSRKTVDILDEHKKNIESVRNAYHVDERPKKEMTKEERKRYDGDRFKVYWNTTKKFGKNYALAGTLAATSFFSFRYSYKTTVKLLAKAEERAAVATAAASALQAKFNNYREEVIDRYGEQADFDIMNKLNEGWTEVGEGKKKIKFKNSKEYRENVLYSFNRNNGSCFNLYNHAENICRVQAIIQEMQNRLDSGKYDGFLIKDILENIDTLNRDNIIIPIEWEVLGYEKGDIIDYELVYDHDVANLSSLCERDYYGNRIEAPEISVLFKHAAPVLKTIYTDDPVRAAMEDAFITASHEMRIAAENNISLEEAESNVIEYTEEEN